MTPLIVVLGIVGAILILIGLVGGDFTLSGKLMPQVAMPKIGNWVRLPCFSVGAVLVAVAIGLGAATVRRSPGRVLIVRQPRRPPRRPWLQHRPRPRRLTPPTRSLPES